MSDLIRRQDAIDALIKAFADAEDGDEKVECGAYWYHGTVMSIIKSLPSADRPTGEWKQVDLLADRLCSVCGYGVWDSEAKEYNYCPHCGTLMRGDSDG